MSRIASHLEVPSMPIYIQEKIQPQAIIENVRLQAIKGELIQLSLFADFNGIQFEDLIDFYHHEQNWAKPHDIRGQPVGNDLASGERAD